MHPFAVAAVRYWTLKVANASLLLSSFPPLASSQPRELYHCLLLLVCTLQSLSVFLSRTRNNGDDVIIVDVGGRLNRKRKRISSVEYFLS